VVIFAVDLKNVGDVRQLQGRVIEVHGPVKGIRWPVARDTFATASDRLDLARSFTCRFLPATNSALTKF
jgi:hypothetical protein